jgi:hypothetical protein
MKNEPDAHAPGCILDPALYSDEIAALMKVPQETVNQEGLKSDN